MDAARNVGFFFILPIVLGLATWLIDRAGIALPNWVISVAGCIVFAGVAYGLFYPLRWCVDRIQFFRWQLVLRCFRFYRYPCHYRYDRELLVGLRARRCFRSYNQN